MLALLASCAKRERPPVADCDSALHNMQVNLECEVNWARVDCEYSKTVESCHKERQAVLECMTNTKVCEACDDELKAFNVCIPGLVAPTPRNVPPASQSVPTP